MKITNKESGYSKLTRAQKIMVTSKTAEFFLFNCCWPYIYELIMETLTSTDFSAQKTIVFGSGAIVGFIFSRYRDKMLKLKRTLYYLDILSNVAVLIGMLINPNYKVYYWLCDIIFCSIIQQPIDLVAENIKNKIFVTGESREYYAAAKTQFCSIATLAGALVSFVSPQFIPEPVMLLMLSVSQFIESALFLYLDKYSEKQTENNTVESIT